MELAGLRGQCEAEALFIFHSPDAASLQIYEPHEQHVSMRQLQLQLQLHFVAINIIMRPALPFPLSLPLSAGKANNQLALIFKPNCI